LPLRYPVTVGVVAQIQQDLGEIPKLCLIELSADLLPVDVLELDEDAGVASVAVGRDSAIAIGISKANNDGAIRVGAALFLDNNRVIANG